MKVETVVKEKLLSQIQDLSDQAAAKADEYSGVIGNVKGVILEHFGPNGLIAAYIVLAVLVLVVVSRLARITFSTLKYLVMAVALAVLASFVLPYSLVFLLPVTVTGCSLFLLFRG